MFCLLILLNVAFLSVRPSPHKNTRACPTHRASYLYGFYVFTSFSSRTPWIILTERCDGPTQCKTGSARIAYEIFLDLIYIFCDGWVASLLCMLIECNLPGGVPLHTFVYVESTAWWLLFACLKCFYNVHTVHCAEGWRHFNCLGGGFCVYGILKVCTRDFGCEMCPSNRVFVLLRRVAFRKKLCCKREIF